MKTVPVIRKYYSRKSEALNWGRRYSSQEREDIYLHQAVIGEYLNRDQYEYSLRKRSEVLDPKSVDILKCWKYKSDKPEQTVESTPTSSPQRTGGVEMNLPAGCPDPADIPELCTCPHCDGDRVGEHDDPCHLCEGEGIVLDREYHEYKADEKADSEANQ